jgi:dethiobiotin synthetase
MKRYFITGTDTDCGKTFVTRLLLDNIAHSVAIKPLSTGCFIQNGELTNHDAVILSEGSGLCASDINPWRFTLPASPNIAAEYENKTITSAEIAAFCEQFVAHVAQGEREQLLNNIKILLVEGAGGVMVPLNNEETWVDFLKCTQMPVIFVVGIKLGCLNHALLSMSVMRMHGIEVVGWIANCIDKDMIGLEENIKLLQCKIDVPLLAKVDYCNTTPSLHDYALKLVGE